MKEEAMAREIIRWMKTVYMRKDGLICSSVDKRGNMLNSYPQIVDDLGDYIPFFAYFGESDFAKEEIKIIKRRYMTKHGLFSTPRIIIDISKIDDLLLGFLEFYNLTGDTQSLALAEKFVDGLFKYCLRKDGFLYRFILPIGMADLRVPLSIIKGTYVELLTDLYQFTRNEKYLRGAELIAENWLKTDFFRENYLFPNYHPDSNKLLLRFCKKPRTAIIMKDNTSMVWGLLALYKATKRKELKTYIYQWVESVKTKMMENGAVYSFWDKENGGYKVELTRNFAVVDLLCDIAHVFKDKSFLKTAKKISDFWINVRGNTGLIPEMTDVNFDFLDAQTDFATALYKLTELSGNSKYRKVGRKLIKKAIEFHRMEYGYALRVNVNSGDIVDSTIDTKFVALFLKSFILLSKRKKIYNTKLWSLLRDR